MAILYAVDLLTGLKADRAPVYRPPGGGNIAAAIGVFEFVPSMPEGDVIRFCKIPPGSIVLGGTILATVIGGTLPEINFGWEANGAEDENMTGLGSLSGAGVVTLTPVIQTFTRTTWLSGWVASAGGAEGQLLMAVQFAVR